MTSLRPRMALRFPARSLAIAVASMAALAAQAQVSPSAAGTSSYGATRDSWIPYTTNGYVGASIGRSKYGIDNRFGNALNFDDSDTMGKIYAGGQINRNFGLEFGYLHFGNAERAGGTVRAQGINLSAVGRLPLNEQFDIFGKVGTTYGWTRSTANAGSGYQSGNENGFGISYGVGASYFFTPQWGIVAEWESHRMKFVGERQNVKAATIGVQYRF